MMMPWRAKTAILALFPILLSAATPRAAQPDLSEPPNVVLIFVDDVGYGDLSCYGHPTIRTERLDRMAREGLRLTSFYSAPTCVPARVQLMTGRYPPRVKLGGVGPGGKGGIPDDEVTLAQALKAVGYRTAMMGKWHLGNASPDLLPIGKGFDYWFGLPYSNDMRRPWVKTDVPLCLYENAEKVEQHPIDQTTLTTRYTERSVRFIREAKDGPFFLYLAHSMAHLPVFTTDEFLGKSRGGLYGDVIETIDWSVGRILDTLVELKLDEKTIVIFTSDNGPWLNLPARMLQEGNLPWHAGSPGPLRGSKATTFEGGPRVPCIIRWPGHIPAGRASAEMAATMDLYVTLVRAAGGELPDHPVDGYDLMPFLTGAAERSPRDTFLYYRGSGDPDSIRVGPWKLRVRDGVHLFNLEIDPSERYDRAEEHPELVERLRSRLQELTEEVKSGGPGGD